MITKANINLAQTMITIMKRILLIIESQAGDDVKRVERKKKKPFWGKN